MQTAAVLQLTCRCGHLEEIKANPGTEATLVRGAAMADCRLCRLGRLPSTAYRASNPTSWRVYR